MKKLVLLISTVLSTVLIFAQSPSKFASTLNEGDYVPNKIIVKFKTSGNVTLRTLSSPKGLNFTSGEAEVLVKKFPENNSSKSSSILKLQESFGLNRIYELTFSKNKKIEDVLWLLNQREDVEYAEPLYIAHTDYTPNDQLYANVSSYLSQIKAPQAWDLIRNTPRVIIAIVDSGSDLDHEDLAANIYINTNDPIDGVDNDGDGFTDNYWGWDFVGASNKSIQPDNDPNSTMASGDHGVHVSGIASAVSDNSKGVASVAFNCAKLMIVKTASDTQGTEIVSGFDGIKYAADHGANIINCSWGSEQASSFGQDVVNYAISRGCLVVAAAGNSGVTTPQYPAGYTGVIAVANVQNNDVKSSSSNFGNYITLAAPGSGIYSTIISSYEYKSGTSMAAPVVSSAAALVKAYFPNLTMNQVGEKLRVTADNIDSKNPAFVNQLGKGRINVLRALTESQPSIKKQEVTITDKGSGSYVAGDTLTIYAIFKNILDPVSNLKVTLKSEDEFVVVTQSSITIPFLGTQASSQNIGPFKVYIKPGTPDNYLVNLRFEYTTTNNSYKDFEGFSTQINRDYLNQQTSTISTTSTSIGRVGFVTPGDINTGEGFKYKGEQLLYEASLIIAKSPTIVSDNARSTDKSFNESFVKRVKISSTTVADTVKTNAEFDDSASPTPLNLYVKQRSFVVKNTASDNYMITEYEVVNKRNSDLNNVYIGLFNDFDISNSSSNATEYDSDNHIAYVYDKASQSSPYAAVRLLSEAPPAYYPLSSTLSGNLLAQDFTLAEKYQTLSSGIYAKGLSTSGNGSDVAFVAGYGPYWIPANGSVKAAFAYIGGSNLVQVQNAGNVAKLNYAVLSPDIDSGITELGIFSYYNTEDNVPYVVISLPESANISLKLYNLFGQPVQTIKEGQYIKGKYAFQVANTESLGNGIYFYRLLANGKSKTFKTKFIH